MQVQDEEKRVKILTAAAELFAAQPFHKVCLSDVAEAAAVGKGTLYTYFKNKEDLYLSVLYSGFTRLVERLRTWIGEGVHNPMENLEAVIQEIVAFAYQNPHHFKLMHSVLKHQGVDRSKWEGTRRELLDLIEAVIREGNRQGLFDDPHPELTARFIPGCVRFLMIDGSEMVAAATVSVHLTRFVLAGLRKKRIA
ncbi:MAG: TetR/AcrR family transcriptional regulator [Desulfosarcinaceae bacterium]